MDSLSQHLFNVHDLIHLMTAGLCVLLAVPLLLRHQQQGPELPLAGFLATQAVAAISYVLIYSEKFGAPYQAFTFPFQFLPLSLAYLLQGIFLVQYSYALSRQPVRWHKVDIGIAGFLLIISALSALAYLPIFSWTSDNGFSGAFPPGPPLLISLIFGVRAVRVIRHYNKEIRQHYSNIDNSSLRWLAYAACGFVVIWIWRWLDDGVLQSYPAIMLVSSMVVLGVSHRGRSTAANARPVIEPVTGRVTGPVTGPVREAVPEAPEASISASTPTPTPEHTIEPTAAGPTPKPSLVSGAQTKQAAKLEQLMTTVRLYEDPELDLEGLADSMDMSARSLSTLINTQFNKSFYDFVNHYRVAAAKAQLLSPQNVDKPIQRVFEDVGFRSKSTFNSVFKKQMGQTPSAFRRIALRENLTELPV